MEQSNKMLNKIKRFMQTEIGEKDLNKISPAIVEKKNK